MKTKFLNKTAFVAAFVCLTFSANAQDTLKISLAQALDIALSESPTIKVAEKEIQRVDYSKKSAWYGLIPNVEASGQYAKYLAPAKMSMMGQIMDSPTDFNATATLSASLPLFAPALWHSIQMTTLEMQLAQEKAKASKITLRNEVSKAYYNVLVAQDGYKVLQNGYNIAKQNYDVAKKGYEVGLIAAYDHISAEVQVNNLLPQLLQVENGINQAKMYLKVLMGMDVAQPVQTTETLADFETGIVAINSLSEISLEGNSDLRQIDIQRQQLAKSLQLQRSQRLPTLAAFGQYGYAGMGNKETNMSFGGMPIQVQASENWYGQGLIVGLQLHVPLTGIFTNTAKEKQLKIQSEALTVQRAYAEDGLRVQAVAALDNMNKAVKQIEAAQKSVDLSEQAYNISSKRYENGSGTMLELQSASLSITQAKLSYNQAISDYLSAKADLEKLLGK